MAEQRIAFNSSMPRSGSTLLQNILSQNPRFCSSPTSGLCELILASRTQFSGSPQFKAQDADLMRKAFLAYCRGAIVSYAAAVTDKPVYVDKSRAWIQYYELLEGLFPKPKVVACVRDLRAILSSMEKLFRQNKHLQDPQEIHERMNMTTVEARVHHWLNSIPVGIQIMRILDAIQTGVYRHCHFVRFEDLTTDPQKSMKAVYEYLEEPYFEHDFEHVEQVTQEDDSQYPIYGDHRIRAAVRPVAPDYEQVLGRELSQRVVADNQAYFQTFYPRVR